MKAWTMESPGIRVVNFFQHGPQIHVGSTSGICKRTHFKIDRKNPPEMILCDDGVTRVFECDYYSLDGMKRDGKPFKQVFINSKSTYKRSALVFMTTWSLKTDLHCSVDEERRGWIMPLNVSDHLGSGTRYSTQARYKTLSQDPAHTCDDALFRMSPGDVVFFRRAFPKLVMSPGDSRPHAVNEVLVVGDDVTPRILSIDRWMGEAFFQRLVESQYGDGVIKKINEMAYRLHDEPELLLLVDRNNPDFPVG